MSIFDMDLTKTMHLFLIVELMPGRFHISVLLFSLTMHMFCQKVKFLKAVKVSERLRRKMAKAKGWGRCFSRVRGIFGEATVPSLWPSTSSWPWWRPVLLSRWYKKTYFVKDIAKSYINLSKLFNRWKDPLKWAIILIFRAFPLDFSFFISSPD